MFRSLMLIALLAATPALAEDPMQLCVNQCMFHHGPAGSAAYDSCIAQICDAQLPEPADWQLITTPESGAHGAEITVQGRSLSYLCRDGGPALVAVAGLGGGGSDMVFQVDGQAVPATFVTENGVHYSAADAGTAMLRALMAGRQVTAVAGQITVSFPLAGSANAIRQAMARCGLNR